MNHKDILAKLLAEEDISIIREAVPTASFDIKNRILRLPIWEDLEEDIEDTLISHEISHAKHSDPEHFIIPGISSLKHSIINIVEDNRIERFIKLEYPVFKSIYISAYRKLYDRGFFKYEHKLLVDKINVYSKVGLHSGVIFNSEEEQWFDRVNATMTPEDVLSVADALYEYTINEYTDEKLEYTDDTGDDIVESKSPETISEDEINDSLSSNHFNSTIAELANTDSEYYNYETGNKFNYYDNVIITYDMIIRDSENIRNSLDKEEIIHIDKVLNRFDEYLDKTKSIVNVMVKEFIMMKSADEYKRTTEYKTGELNSKKLYLYKISDKIFKSRGVVSSGDNHGMIILMDWSGSMGLSIHDCIDQITNLVMFCRKVNIPFRVYSFTTHSLGMRKKKVEKDKTKLMTEVHLLELYTSEMNDIEFNQMMKILYSGILMYDKKGYGLSMTALNFGLLYINDIMTTFKKLYSTQKNTLVIISDGDDTCGLSLSTSDHKCNKINVIKDSVTKITYKMTNDNYEVTENLIRIIRDRNKNSTMMFYLPNNVEDIQLKVANLNLEKISETKYVKTYKSKYIDKYFFVEKSSLNTRNDNEDFSEKMKYDREIRMMMRELIREFS